MTFGIIPPEFPKAPDSYSQAGVGMVGSPVPDFSSSVASPSDLVVVPRTPAQLAGTPSASDVSLTTGFVFSSTTAPTDLFRVSADGLSYVPISDQAPRLISGTYVLSKADDKAQLYSTSGVTVVIPAALALQYGVIVRCPATGSDTISPASGAVLINGVSSSVTRTRASCPNGYAITPNSEADSWGVSNGVVAQAPSSFASLTGVPADSAALAAALALKADVASVPQVLLRSGPRTGVAQGSAQIFAAGSANPSQVLLPAGTLATTSQRISVKFFVLDNGTTDPLAVLLYLGTLGTISDTTIGTTGSLAAANRLVEGEYIIQRIDATHIACRLVTVGASTTAFAGGSIVVPDLDATALMLSLGVKTGTTDVPTLGDCQMELR